MELIYLLLDNKLCKDWDIIKKKLNDGTFIQRIKKF